MAEPYLLSLTEMVTQVSAGRLSPVTLMESVLKRIDSVDPPIQAWVTIDRKRFLEEARRHQDEISRGKSAVPCTEFPLASKIFFIPPE